MKRYLLLATSIVSFAVTGQTNSFPPSGNVGIGTNNPDSKLEIQSSGAIYSNEASLKIKDLTSRGTMFLESVADQPTDFVFKNNNRFSWGISTRNSSDSYALRFFPSTNGVSWSSPSLSLLTNGNVGIGTISPTGKLHVSSGTSGDAIFRLEADTDNNNEFDNPLIQLRQDGGQLGVNIGFSEENFGGNIFGIGTRYSNQEKGDAFTINTSNGNVGIGTKNAGTWKLAVKGQIRAEEIKVETGWADYVFQDGYELPSLEEVEKHIKEKGHLVNIPSAEEVRKNGIFLGEMNMKLLQKIEELTLYAIEQEKKMKRINVLEEQNKLLNSKITVLEILVQKLVETKK